jgi:hypothetical protein
LAITLQSIASAVRLSLALQVARRTDEDRRAAIKLAQRLATDEARRAELKRRMESLDEKTDGWRREAAARIEQQQLDDMAAQIMRRQARLS